MLESFTATVTQKKNNSPKVHCIKHTQCTLVEYIFIYLFNLPP